MLKKVSVVLNNALNCKKFLGVVHNNYSVLCIPLGNSLWKVPLIWVNPFLSDVSVMRNTSLGAYACTPL